jgi:hypothetical protein
MLNGRKRRTVSFDEQQLLQVVQQEDERKRKLMRELEQEELADKKANKRVGKLLQAATPKKRVQVRQITHSTQHTPAHGLCAMLLVERRSTWRRR